MGSILELSGFALGRPSRSALLVGLWVMAGCQPEQAGLDPEPGVAVVSIDLTPDSVSVELGETVAFGLTARRSDGSVVPTEGEVVVTGGSIDANRRYRADAPGSHLAVARVVDGTRMHTDTSRIIVAPPPPQPPPGALGVNADLRPGKLFPASNPWNQSVASAPVDPNSDRIVALIGATKAFHPDFGALWNGGPFGIPYIVVSGSQAKVPVSFTYASESDPGPYPVPSNAPIEGGPTSSGDRHVLVVDRDAWKLYELYAAYPQPDGSWQAGSGAVFDLSSNALRPAGWTSADAAGLPILPGLVRYDEVQAGVIDHALRFTVSRTRRAYLHPARHWASSDTSSLRPPMGMRVRLKASFDISTFPPSARVILAALKEYGMIVADNGSDWYLSGVADSRWNDGELNSLKALRGSDFEVIQMTGVVTP